jgi:hypothetical protein
MNRTHALGFISLFILGAGTAFVACSSESPTATPGYDSGVKDTATGTDTGPGVDSGPAVDSGPGVDTGMSETPTAMDGTLKSFNFPSQLSSKTKVHTTTIVALSQKFLVSFSKTSGSCLYGFFAADPATTYGEYSGALIISYGTKGTVGGSSSSCAEGDAIPGTVKAGDQFEMTGSYSAYAPSSTSCAAAPNPAKIPEIDVTSTVGGILTPKAAGTVPAPAVVTEADLKNGSANLSKWILGWVKISTVTAGGPIVDDAGMGIDGSSVLLADGGIAATDYFGTFTTSGGIPVGDKLYFKAEGAPWVGPGQAFTSIQGIPYLDFCNWTLFPTHLTDMAPTPAVKPAGDAATGG